MDISDSQKVLIIEGLVLKRDINRQARKKDVDDYSSKWNDKKEEKARSLDRERDEIDSLIQEISKSTGKLNW